MLLQDDDDMGTGHLGKKTQYTAPLNVLNDLAQDKVFRFIFIYECCIIYLHIFAWVTQSLLAFDTFAMLCDLILLIYDFFIICRTMILLRNTSQRRSGTGIMTIKSNRGLL